MADSVKINQLPHIDDPSLNDDVIVVHNGLTRITPLRNIANTIQNGGSQSDFNSIERKISILSSETFTELSALRKNCDNNASTTNAELNALKQKIPTSLNADTINDINKQIDNLKETLNSISSLTDNPNLLTSIQSLIDLLMGEDGKTSLSSIMTLSNDLSSLDNKIEYELTPLLKDISSTIDVELGNYIYENSVANNKVVAITYNKDYNYKFDDNCFNITSDYTPPENDEESEETGRDTFSLNMIPIRAGMLNGNGNLKLKLSGTTDVEIYYANETSIVSNYLANIRIKVNNISIAARRSGDNVKANDTTLELITKQKFKGGSIIEFLIDGNISSITNPEEEPIPYDSSKPLHEHNLIAAIKPILSKREGQPTRLKIVSAKYVENGANEISFRIDGGYTGDQYNLYAYNNSELTGQPLINNAIDYSINNDCLYNVENSFTNNGFVPPEAMIYLKATKTDDPSNVLSAAAIVS